MIPSLRLPLLLGAAIALSSCGVLKQAKPKTPVLGQRVPILVAEANAVVDPTLASIEVLLPPATANDAWAQPSGNAAHAMGHLALGATPTRAWDAKIAGGTKRERLASAPVVSGGRVFVIDTNAQVHAFDAKTGSQVWQAFAGDSSDDQRGKDTKRNQKALFGGGVSVDGDKLYATNGLGDVVAMNAADGSVIWRKRPGGPLRGSPTVSNGNIYVVSQDNQIFALRQSDGNVEWTQAGTLEVSGVFGVAAPAAAQGTVIAGYSSGELIAYRYENGRSLWADALARTSISTEVGALTDIDADPIIDQGRVYALGQGGRMAAYELVTGQRIWELNLAGISTPAVAGEWIFTLTDDARLLAIARGNGKVRWITDLGQWRNVEKKKDPIFWTGPVLAGNALWVANSQGQIYRVSPGEGTSSLFQTVKAPISLAPVVANNTLYVLDDDGVIHAYR